MLNQIREVENQQESIAAEIVKIREENDRQTAVIEKWEAHLAIENLMGSFSLYCSQGAYEKAFSLFAPVGAIYLQRSDVGVYEGYPAVKGYFQSLAERAVEGSFRIVPIDSPVIEIAEDGKTAQGIWFINGMEALKDPDNADTPAADLWTNDKLAVEFICEKGEWYIFRMTRCEEMRGLYHKSWGEYAENPEYPKFDRFPAPTRSADRHLPFRADRKSQKNIKTPVAYKTYSDLEDHF